MPTVCVHVRGIDSVGPVLGAGRRTRHGDAEYLGGRHTVWCMQMSRLGPIDDTIIRFLRRWSITALRISVAVVFIWFGALKVFDVTPVADLVADTVYWVDPDWFVPLLGVFEIVVGASLLARRALRVMLGLFALQMAGTFLVLVLQPDVAFQDGNPLLLTVEGEFVIKNLVLLSAGMVVGATVRRREAIARGGSAPSEATFTNV